MKLGIGITLSNPRQVLASGPVDYTGSTITVTGTISDAFGPISVPITRAYAGIVNGKPSWVGITWDTGYNIWKIQIGEAFWASQDNTSTPDLAIYIPIPPSTGTPTLTLTLA